MFGRHNKYFERRWSLAVLCDISFYSNQKFPFVLTVNFPIFFLLGLLYYNTNYYVNRIKIILTSIIFSMLNLCTMNSLALKTENKKNLKICQLSQIQWPSNCNNCRKIHSYMGRLRLSQPVITKSKANYWPLYFTWTLPLTQIKLTVNTAFYWTQYFYFSRYNSNKRILTKNVVF